MSAEALVDDMVLADEAPADFESERTPSRRTKRCLQDESVWRTFDDARDVVKREVAVTRPPTARSTIRTRKKRLRPAAGIAQLVQRTTTCGGCADVVRTSLPNVGSRRERSGEHSTRHSTAVEVVHRKS
jgi:hypothetical protein